MNKILLLLFLLPIFSFGQTSSQTYSSPGTYSFTVPAGVNNISVQAWGAGGGGDNYANKGGGGGAFAGNNSISVISGNTYTIIVGSGAGNGTGNNGEDSSFGSIVIAKGGNGGSGSNPGRGGQASASTGTIVFNGGNGGSSTANGGAGGGGAGSATNPGNNGGNSNNNPGGSGGSGGIAGVGDGGDGGNKNSNGSDGSFPGGGGGERGENGYSSGGGGNGQVKISWSNCATASPTGASFQSFCLSDSPKVSNLVASGSNIKWYSSLTGGSVLASTTDLSSGHYYATQTVSGCESTNRLDVVVNVGVAPSATGVVICSGGSGSLVATSSCGSSFSATQTATGSGGTSDLTTYTNKDIAINFPSLPAGAVVTSISTTITYTSNYPSYTNELRIQVTPPAALGGVQGDLQVSTSSSSSGTLSNKTFGSWGTGNPSGNWLFKFRETYNDSSINPDADISNISIVVNYTLPVTLDWYNAGGVKIGSGTPFNPVGVSNSGLPNTNSPGTTTYYAACSLSSSCRTPVNFVINSVPNVPTTGTITQPNCVTSTGSVVLNGLPATWTLNRTGTSSATTSGTGTSTTISGLAAGTYQFTVSNGSCPSGATSNIVINTVVTNTWNGSIWSNGTPTLNDKIVFSANYPPSPDPNVDILGCSCRITGSTNVVIRSGRTLKITNEVDVQPTATLTFENGASLVQINDTPITPNSGNIKYKRETTPISNMDYTYWSSPVAAQTLYNLSPNTLGDKFYSFDSGIDNWKPESSATTMAVGKGYIVRGPQNYAAPLPPNIYLANFIGVPHNGVKSTPIGVAGNSNLLGNPYPSALDADSFLTANSGVLEGTIYFWTHNTNIGIGVSNPGSGIYAYSSDDYAAYNLTGGVGTQPATSSGPNTNTPSGKIASGQAFFTTSKAAGNAVFNNSMRVGVGSITGDNSQFFKNASNTKANTTTIEKNRLWLNLYNDQDAFKQTLIGYVTGATNIYDSSFDGESYDSNEYLDFYSINEDKNLVIQGRALPFDVSDEVPLGYSSTIVGELKIAIGQVDGSLENSNVFLEDKLLKITHNLNESPYSFTTEKGVFNDRFIVSYANKTLAIKDFVDSKSGVLISNKNKEILIKSSDVLINKVFVYDFSGKQLYKKIKVEHHENKILHLGAPDQVLIVKVVLQNGQTVSKKILF